MLADLIFIIQYVQRGEEEGTIPAAANTARVKSFRRDIFVELAGTLGDEGPKRLRALIIEFVCLRHVFEIPEKRPRVSEKAVSIFGFERRRQN